MELRPQLVGAELRTLEVGSCAVVRALVDTGAEVVGSGAVVVVSGASVVGVADVGSEVVVSGRYVGVLDVDEAVDEDELLGSELVEPDDVGVLREVVGVLSEVADAVVGSSTAGSCR